MSASEVLQSLLGSKINPSQNHESLLGTPKLNKRRVFYDKTVKLSNGKSIVLKAKGIKKLEDKRRILKKVTGNDDETTGINMNELWNQISIADEINNQKDNTNDLLNEYQNSVNTFNSNKLWTEKYRPKKFLDLLGNERVNSFILKWLNDWKYCVKGGQLKQEGANDPLNRPFKKILLIHGPPGIGKTTIAHCIGRQLRYEVHEINSSDERSGENVRNKILNSLKVRSLSGKDICLILDEIDGASGAEGGFIRLLVNLLNKDKRASDQFINGDKKYNSKDLLRRPIIAICNDVYSPALDVLKPYCELVSFKKTTNQFIKKRLKRICEIEHLGSIDDSFLDDLVISMDGDIRNCINFLQFNSTNLENGLKDNQIAWFQILKRVFNRSAKQSKTHQFKTLFNELLSSPNQLDKVNNGCFNAIPSLDNISLTKVNEVYDWFNFYDIAHKNSNLFERDDLIGYNSIVPMKIYQLFNEVGSFNKDLSFKSMELYDSKKQIRDILNQMNYKNLNTNLINLITFELNMIFTILVPTELPIKKFINKRNSLTRICEIIQNQEIRIENIFMKQRGANNFTTTFIEKFKPDIGSILFKDGDLFSPYIKVLKNQLHEIYKQELENKEAAKLSIKRPSDDSEIDRDGLNSKRRAVSSVDYFKQQYSNFATQTHKHKDGQLSATSNNNGHDQRIMSLNDNRIWIKYHEGFSNAVRKEITWDTLFETGNFVGP